jgi:hypothetical protein
MKKLIIPMLIFLAWTISLSAQITQEQADKIVLEHLQNEVTPPYLLYVNVNAPSEAGIAVTTFQEETFTAKYACWAYYLNENPEITEPDQHRYLSVKANDGNLLEVITTNDRVPDLAQWTEVTTAINELQNHVKIYPNPMSGELRVESGGLRIKNIEIFDAIGKLIMSFTPSFSGNVHHIPAFGGAWGGYFIRITTDNGTITQKIIKN